MNFAHQAAVELRLAQERFDRSTGHLTEELSGFSPAEEAMTTCQHVAHCAQVVDWFIEGAFRSEGFDMDFDSQISRVRAVRSLAEARGWFNRSMNAAVAFLSARSDGELSAPIAAGPVMGGHARFAIVSAIVDHTAHHRGALTVYARTNGITPPDPYLE